MQKPRVGRVRGALEEGLVQSMSGKLWGVTLGSRRQGLWLWQGLCPETWSAMRERVWRGQNSHREMSKEAAGVSRREEVWGWREVDMPGKNCVEESTKPGHEGRGCPAWQV